MKNYIVQLLRGDYSKAKKKLGWVPKVDFEQLVTMMVDADLKRIKGARKLSHEPRTRLSYLALCFLDFAMNNELGNLL